MSLSPTNSYSVTSTTANQTITSPSFTPATNDVMVVKFICEDTAGTSPTTSISATGGGITWTSRVLENTSSNCYVRLWTGIVTSGGTSITVSVASSNFAGTGHSMQVEQWSGSTCKLAASPATAGVTGQSTATTTITTAANGSAVSWCNGDWNAVAPGTPTLASSATLESDPNTSGGYTAYYAYQQAATAGSQTFGVTAPTGQKATLVGIEIQAAGGTNYTGSPSDNEALTDSASAVQTMVRSQTDSEALTDSTALFRGKSQADSEALTDATALTRGKTQADSEALTDSATRVQQMQRSVSDSAALTDSVTKVQHLARTQADTAALTDHASTVQALHRTQADSEALTDTTHVVQTLFRSPADSLAMTDTVTVVKTMVRTVADSEALTDAATYSLNGGGTNYTRSPADALAMTDHVSTVMTITRTFSDSLAMTDTASRAVGYTRSVADHLAATDSATKSMQYARTISDSEAMSDTTARTQAMSRTLAESMALSDATSHAMTILRSVSDSMALTDSAVGALLRNLGADGWAVLPMFMRWAASLGESVWDVQPMFSRWEVDELEDKYVVGTQVNVRVPITLDGAAVTNTNVTAVAFSVVPFGTPPGSYSTSGLYASGYWTLPTTGLAAGRYAVYAKLTTNTGETPILYCGTILIVASA